MPPGGGSSAVSATDTRGVTIAGATSAGKDFSALLRVAHSVLVMADSDAYFASRPWQSRVGAWASQQSAPIASREALLKAVADTAKRFHIPDPTEPAGEAQTAGFGQTDPVIPRPPHWGGYHLWADAVELWVEGEARVHDRARWTRELTPQDEGFFSAGAWTATRLQP